MDFNKLSEIEIRQGITETKEALQRGRVFLDDIAVLGVKAPDSFKAMAVSTAKLCKKCEEELDDLYKAYEQVINK